MKALRIHVDVDDTYDAVHNFFKYDSVRIEFFRSFVPPHKVIYTVGPFQDIGAERFIERFKELGAKFTATELEVRNDWI